MRIVHLYFSALISVLNYFYTVNVDEELKKLTITVNNCMDDDKLSGAVDFVLSQLVEKFP